MHCNTLILPILITFYTNAFGAPVQQDEQYNFAVAFLVKYNYLPQLDSEVHSKESVRAALTLYQRTSDLPTTGELDDATLDLMKKPRCGLTVSVLANYGLTGSKWRTTSLTYRIKDYSAKMNHAVQDEIIARAFKVWSDATPLTFTQVTSTPYIDIRFAVLAHGDGEDFDGPGGTLAHAYFPFAGGAVHLDDDENFTDKTTRGINLFQVAAHEIGHALGLEHSGVWGSLMYPSYLAYIPNFNLPQDDIDGIQAIYGPNRNSNNPTRTTLPPGVRPNYCSDPRLDAIVSMQNGDTYGFRGKFYYKFDDAGVASGYPRIIASDWPGMSENIDAAISFPASYNGLFWSEQIWIFKDNYIYKYNSGKSLISTPVEIGRTLPGLPDNIDSIFFWSGNNKTYATKGSSYYKLKNSIDGIETGYPRTLNVWLSNSAAGVQRALANGIDAAVKYNNGLTYWFAGTQYYRFNEKSLVVDSGYPRDIGPWWYGC